MIRTNLEGWWSGFATDVDERVLFFTDATQRLLPRGVATHKHLSMILNFVLELRVEGGGLRRVEGSGFRVQGGGLRVQG